MAEKGPAEEIQVNVGNLGGFHQERQSEAAFGDVGFPGMPFSVSGKDLPEDVTNGHKGDGY